MDASESHALDPEPSLQKRFRFCPAPRTPFLNQKNESHAPPGRKNSQAAATRTSVQVLGPLLLRQMLEATLVSSPSIALNEAAVDVLVIVGENWDVLLCSANPYDQETVVSQRQPAVLPAVLITEEISLNVPRAVGHGVCSFVGFADPISILLQGVEAARQGLLFCSPSLLPMVMRNFTNGPVQARQEEPPVKASFVTDTVRLSAREREIARYAAAGLSNAEIASLLYVSLATVKFHLVQVFRKLGISRRSQLHKVLTP